MIDPYIVTYNYWTWSHFFNCFGVILHNFSLKNISKDGKDTMVGLWGLNFLWKKINHLQQASISISLDTLFLQPSSMQQYKHKIQCIITLLASLGPYYTLHVPYLYFINSLTTLIEGFSSLLQSQSSSLFSTK